MDIIKNIGPIGTLTVSENCGYSNNDLNDSHHMRLANEMSFVEMVATTGQGEFGAVSLINFTVKPRLHSVFELSSDFRDMWWVEGGSVLSTEMTNQKQPLEPDNVKDDTSSVDDQLEHMDTGESGTTATNGNFFY